MMSFFTFLKCLPEFLALYRTLEAAAQEAEIKRKVKEDVKIIHEAFSAKDANKLNSLFNSK